MTDCKNCNYTDEYCASGDCTAQLNKQWYEDMLEKDKYYYAKDSSEGDCIVHINKSNEMTFTGWEVPYEPDQSNILEPFKLRTELLAQVPSYEEYLSLTYAKEEDEKIIAEYEEENQQLKELLKECKEVIKNVDTYYGNYDATNGYLVIKKIDEVLNA
jgi:hypothetical protein